MLNQARFVKIVAAGDWADGLEGYLCEAYWAFDANTNTFTFLLQFFIVVYVLRL